MFHIPTVLQHAVKPAVITCYTGMSITFQKENHYFGLPFDLVEFCIAHLAISKTQAEKISINQILDKKKEVFCSTQQSQGCTASNSTAHILTTPSLRKNCSNIMVQYSI